MPEGPSREFPLFPLGLVALPGELIPLHIFEERYKTMIDECIGAASASSGSCGCPTTACARSAARARSTACSSGWMTAG